MFNKVITPYGQSDLAASCSILGSGLALFLVRVRRIMAFEDLIHSSIDAGQRERAIDSPLFVCLFASIVCIGSGSLLVLVCVWYSLIKCFD